MSILQTLFGAKGRGQVDQSSAAFSISDPVQLQEWIVVWMADKLKVEPKDVGVDQVFTDFGLDSLSAVSLSGALEERLGRHISPSIAWEYPTVAELSAYLAAGGSGSEAEDDFETGGAVTAAA